MAFKSKAESSFESKLEVALLDRNWSVISHVFAQFGAYLELVGLDQPLGKSVIFQWPTKPMTKSVVPWHEQMKVDFDFGGN